MNYMEILTTIEESGEKILAQELNYLITDKHRYIRFNGDWHLDTEPGMAVQKYTKGGGTWIWCRLEESHVG